jgi:uncharacterized Zn finger protein
MAYFGWKPYVPVAKRRAKAEREMKKLARGGKKIEPVVIDGRKIARTFWGESWCDHLEKFSDYENRLPRGRTYVRNGSVCHLGIDRGKIEAMVSGSELYRVEIEIDPLPALRWTRLRDQCTGKIGSALELLQGRLSGEVMQIVAHRDQGLFPKPDEIHMRCNCPDWADLCKHLAAVLYGVGARLDDRPELLFLLRGVDPQELITADADITRAADGEGKRRRLLDDDLEALFGVAMDTRPLPAAPRRPKTAAPAKTPTATPPLRRTPASNKARAAAKPRSGAKSNAPEFIPTAEAVIELRERLQLNKSQFALLVGVSPTTIGNWEKQAGRLNLQRSPLNALRMVSAMTPQAATELIHEKKRQQPKR